MLSTFSNVVSCPTSRMGRGLRTPRQNFVTPSLPVKARHRKILFFSSCLAGKQWGDTASQDVPPNNPFIVGTDVSREHLLPLTLPPKLWIKDENDFPEKKNPSRRLEVLSSRFLVNPSFLAFILYHILSRVSSVAVINKDFIPKTTPPNKETKRPR